MRPSRKSWQLIMDSPRYWVREMHGDAQVDVDASAAQSENGPYIAS